MFMPLRRFCAALAFCLLFAVTAFAEPERFDWGQAEEIHPGVLLVQKEFALEGRPDLRAPHYPLFSPEMPRRVRLFAARVDSKAEALRFVTTGRSEGWGVPMPGQDGEEGLVVRTERQTTADFFRQADSDGRKMLLAVNAAPWRPFRAGLEHLFADRLGLAVSEGELVSPPDGRRPSLLVREDGSLGMEVVSPDGELTGIKVAVSGFAFCLSEGASKGSDTVLHPRTGFGLCEEKRYLYVLVVDGRQPASQGATVREVGEWLRRYGALDGINMDGGGSTTLVRRNVKDGTAEILNRPSFGQRQNGNNFGVFSDQPQAAVKGE